MAFALVAHVKTAGQNGNTSSAIDTTGANLLIATVADYSGGGGVTVSDSKSNTWTACTSQTTGEIRSRIYYAKNPTVGTGHTFSISGSTIFAAADFMAFSGADTTADVDQQNGAATSAGSLATGSVTPSSDNQLVIASFGAGAGTSGTNTIDNGFTITDQDPYTGGQFEGGSGAYLVQTTAGAVNPTWTLGNPGGGVLAACIATFKAASSGRTASASVTESADTASASAQVVVHNTLAATESTDSLSSSTKVRVANTLAVTESNDTLSGSAHVIAHNTAALTETSDSLSASAHVIHAASAALTETSDTLVATAKVTLHSTASLTESADTLSATPHVIVRTTLATTEQSDTLATSAHVVIAGNCTVNVTESADTSSASARVRVATSLAGAETADACMVSSAVRVASSVAVNESSDTVAATSLRIVTLSAALTEQSDSLTASAGLGTDHLSAAIVESPDTLASNSAVLLHLTAAITEAADTLNAPLSNAIPSGIDRLRIPIENRILIVPREKRRRAA